MNKKNLLFDLILVLVLLAIGVSAYFAIEAAREPGAVVAVSVNGERVAEYSLFSDGEYSLNGGTNTLVIKDGEAYVTEASCPDGLCERQGKISRGGERIVCLPNRVIVEIIGEDEILAN